MTCALISCLNHQKCRYSKCLLQGSTYCMIDEDSPTNSTPLLLLSLLFIKHLFSRKSIYITCIQRLLNAVPGSKLTSSKGFFRPLARACNVDQCQMVTQVVWVLLVSARVLLIRSYCRACEPGPRPAKVGSIPICMVSSSVDELVDDLRRVVEKGGKLEALSYDQSHVSRPRETLQ